MTMAVAYVVTRRGDVAASIGVLDTLVKIAAFYIHERLWLRVAYGRVRPPDYQI